MSKYTTGELAKLCGVTVRTVQYYDTRGILSPSELSEGGRRLYTDDDLRQLRIICFLRDMGLPIDAIGQLLAEEEPGRVIQLLLEQQEQEKSFFVAFVGRYSAGKSCLINNLLGRELLPHGTTETTTALTYLRFGEEEKALIHTADGGVQQVTLEQVQDVDQRKELWDPDTLELSLIHI